jgi:hypothetical protein
MTACWFRLTQPENSSRKKASGGGTGAMAGVGLTCGLRSTGARLGILRRHAGLRLLRRRRPQAASIGQFSEDPHAAGVFAHDAIEVVRWSFPARCHAEQVKYLAAADHRWARNGSARRRPPACRTTPRLRRLRVRSRLSNTSKESVARLPRVAAGLNPANREAPLVVSPDTQAEPRAPLLRVASARETASMSNMNVELSWYREYPPPPLLQGRIECFWERSVHDVGGHVHRVLPDGCIDVLFECEGVSAATSYVVGAMTRPLLVARSDAMHVFAVRFKPGAAAQFFKPP